MFVDNQGRRALDSSNKVNFEKESTYARRLKQASTRGMYAKAARGRAAWGTMALVKPPRALAKFKKSTLWLNIE